MNLLPKAADEFRNRDYWDRFFEKLGQEAFEWYSDFIDLAGTLCKYIKPRDEVLVVGCGNSTLSSDLYDTGIERITNIDLSDKVIKQMKKQHEQKRSNMKWMQMDAKQLTFDDNQFSVVLDKGTIDALMSNKSEQVLSDINQILQQIDRVLRMTGRFICITLAQKHILEHVSQYFFNNKSWLLRYHHIQTGKPFALPVFAFVFTKISMKTPLIELQLYNNADNNWLRFTDLTEALNTIQHYQITCYKKHEFKQRFIPRSETPTIDLYAESNQTKPRYQMIVANGYTKYRNKPFAAFVIPKSRNLDWLYSTPAGRQQIIDSAKYTAIAFIYLQSDQEYRDLEQVKLELTAAVIDFKPVSVPDNFQIPFLSSSEGIGQVIIRQRSSSFVIEDCLYGNDDRWKRRLRFENNPNLIQSEVNLIADEETNDFLPDYSILEDDYHGAIVSCLKKHFLTINDSEPNGDWLLIGLGGGVLTMKLIQAFPKMHLTGVDIDLEMVFVAKVWFGLNDKLTKCIIDDGIRYLQQQVEENKTFDVIIFDVNNDNSQSPLRCPHPAFLDDKVLANARALLSDRSGVFVLNFASRDDTNEDRENCLKRLSTNFEHLSSIKLEDDINEIMFASKSLLSFNSKLNSKPNLSMNFDIEKLLSKMIDRYSMNQTDKNYVTNVKILDVEKRYKPGSKHYVYVIQVTWANPRNTFIIYRRYAQFFNLQCKLLDLLAESPSPLNNFNTQNRIIPFLPGKIFLGRSQIRQVALERKIALQAYCEKLILLPEQISRSRHVLEFFQTQPSDVQNSSELTVRENGPTPNTTPVISKPSVLPTYRCIDDFVAVENTEMSLKQNTLVQVIHKQLNGWWFVQLGDKTGFVPGAFLQPVERSEHVQNNSAFPTSSDETYVVNKSYSSNSTDEISLRQGSFVTVIEKSYTGWWTVTFKNATGQFPAVYLTSCKGRFVPTDVPDAASNSLITRISNSHHYEPTNHNEYIAHIESEIYYVHSDFIDTVGDCVSLQRGDVVEIHDKHPSGWWLGRRLKDDYVLKWIPSAFLQKELLHDTYSDNDVTKPQHQLENPVKKTESVNTTRESTYENVGHDASTSATMPTRVFARRGPTVRKTASEQSSSLTNDSESDYPRLSVQDLVKKFNGH